MAYDRHATKLLFQELGPDCTIDIMLELIEDGANVNGRDRYKKTPLHYAVQYADVGVIEFLIKSGSKINARDKDEKTPIHYAIENNMGPFVVKLLVKYGADVNIKCKYGYTPIENALEFDESKPVIDALIKAGAKHGPSVYMREVEFEILYQYEMLSNTCNDFDADQNKINELYQHLKEYINNFRTWVKIHRNERDLLNIILDIEKEIKKPIELSKNIDGRFSFYEYEKLKVDFEIVLMKMRRFWY